MAGADRTTPHALTPRAPAPGTLAPRALELLDRLRQEPWQFGFFAALRRLEAAHRDRPRFGQSLRPVDDPVRLAQEPSLSFAPATLAKFEAGSGGRAPRLLQNFLGLLGPNGPLPLHLTEHARDRLRNSNDPTFARFLDVFNHRMLSLFYRAWAMTEPTVSHDRPEEDRFAQYVGALFGIGMPSFRDRDAMPDLAKLHFAGRLACQTRPPEGLQAILEAFFSMRVQIREFVGEWMELPEDCLCRLGASRETGTLGMTITVGARVWGAHQKFRIAFGPMGFDDFRRLLPGGDSLARLVAIVRNYAGEELTWDVNLILEREEVPPLRLGETARLGWTTWLMTGPLDRDADDLMLKPLACLA